MFRDQNPALRGGGVRGGEGPHQESPPPRLWLAPLWGQGGCCDPQARTWWGGDVIGP